MKQRIKYKITIRLLIFFLIVLCPSIPIYAEAIDYYRVVLLSDPHLPFREREVKEPVKQQKIIEAKYKVLEDINQWTDVTRVVVLGDIAAAFGNEKEYLFAGTYFKKLSKPASYITGNHDYYYADGYSQEGKLVHGDSQSRKLKLQRFKDTFGLRDLFYSERMGNYLLLYLSVDSVTSPYLAEMSKQQLEWLKDTLERNQNIPTIIFYHAPLQGTLLNYNPKVNTPNFTAQPADVLQQIIQSNPQIILWVAGHLHTPVTNPSFSSAVNIYNGRVINIHNTDMDREVICTNSLYLYKDKIVIRTFNHKNETWLDNLERVVTIER